MSVRPPLPSTEVVVEGRVPQPTLLRRLQAQPLPQRAAALIQQIVESGLFAEDMQAKILVWHQRFQNESLPHLSTDEEKIDAGNSVCFLLFAAIRPEMKKQEKDSANADLLDDFEVEIEEILSDLLPSGTDVEAFISDYEAFYAEQATLELKIERHRAITEQRLKTATADAEAANQNLKEIVDRVKQKILAFHATKKASTDADNQRVERLTARTEALYQLLGKTSALLLKTADAVEGHHNDFNQLTEDAGKMLEKKD